MPILNEQEGIEAALSVTGLAVELTAEESLHAIADVLAETARTIGRDLGFFREAKRNERQRSA